MQTRAPDTTEVPLHELPAEVLAGQPAAGGFELHYQPIVRLASRATVAVEALACWRHPDLGIVEPSQFMAGDVPGRARGAVRAAAAAGAGAKDR